MPDLRLKTVKAFLELSLSSQEELKELVCLASDICETPIASINFIDDKNQHSIVSKGHASRVSRDIAFCNYAIKQFDILEVPDARNDNRFINNPLVTGSPYIRFYAGIPLITTDNFTIGTLCVIDQKPKKLTERQAESLKIVSKQVMHQLELHRNVKLLKDSLSETERNKILLEQAEILQNAFYGSFEDYFVLLNKKCEIVSFNTAMEAKMKSSKNGSNLQKGKKFIKCFRAENAAIISPVLKKALDGESTTLEILTKPEDNNELWVKISVSPAYNSRKELIGIACIGYDIDKEKKQQEKINLQNSVLSQIARLHSHEIRQPLTNILAIINIAKHDNYQVTKVFFDYLEISSKQLDKAIRKIVLDSYYAA